MLTILNYPHPILRQRMPKFDFNQPIMNPDQLQKEMLDTMYHHNGIGLSANQVGITARVFVMGHQDTPELGRAFFNPEILECTEETQDLEEGCLSFPGMYVKLRRPVAIRTRYQTCDGSWQEAEFRDYDCRCFLHEFDHLEGIVFRDRISTLKWSIAERRKNKRKIHA